MGYVDYNFYTDTYKGSTIPETAFGNLAIKAESVVDMYTFGRVNTTMPYMNKVKMCCCELAEYLYQQDNLKRDPGVVSEKIGEWSTTYTSPQEVERIKQSTIKGIIYNWLAMTGLLYRGC